VETGSGARGPGWTLVLLRHAKSAWPEGVPDDLRPLAGRGRRAAPVAGRWLRAEGFVPDLVLCSTARRARQTWQFAESGLLEPEGSGGIAAPPVRYEREVYQASAAGLIDLLHRQPARVRTLLLVGHEPGMSELALTLAAAGGPRAVTDEPAGAGDAPGELAGAAPGGSAGEPAGRPGEPAGDAEALARLRAKFPTAAVAVLVSAGDWSRLGPGQARLARFVTPRELQARDAG